MTSDLPVAIPCVDWNTISEEILCPLCDYNLRGLIEPRCPECGYRFEWRGLLDPKYRLHPYLFDHHPERNFRYFWRTALGGWRPRKFWQRLQPAHRLRPKRLMMYWFIAAFISPLLPVMTEIGIGTVVTVRANKAERASTLAWLRSPGRQKRRDLIIEVFGSEQAFLDTIPTTDPVAVAMEIAVGDGARRDTSGPMVILILWPWTTFAALMIFRASMKRAKTKWIHVLRCTVYSSDVILWGAAALVLALLAVSLDVGRGTPLRLFVFQVMPAILVVLCLGTMCYRLMIAYRSYLQFDHPRLTIVAAQVVALLLMSNLIVIPILWAAD